ncbi:uncharacterized protein LOC130746772 [Lotus japonicus]|uniref:uncharacterized protein LOC130746772 n=1 Tax=Lotus japonicus TaxID=34305 RepID=UPI002587F846|nr:uncharacterized protein LOC130746772 [Lotus japonicus]
MNFLMGLNDSFSQVRGSLLLMDPIPPINKVFSLVIQEEKQREVGAGNGVSEHSSQAFAAASSQGGSRSSDSADKAKNSKKDRPICSHCGIPGHTAAKCFKLHGYPPGMKPKSSKSQTTAVAGQASGNFQQSSEGQNVVTTLSPYQCTQLIQLLTHQLTTTSQPSKDVPESSCTKSGQPHFEDDWEC